MASKRLESFLFYTFRKSNNRDSKILRPFRYPNVCSKATELILTITQTSNEARMDLSDNGIGFDISTRLSIFYTAGKLGLLGMMERAELIGGKLEIQSITNKGTTISLSVPISKSDHKVSDNQ